eukprot:1828963-Pyramimonas_sp.AAC.1
MCEVVLSEQQHRVLDFDRVTTMPAFVAAAAMRAAVVKSRRATSSRRLTFKRIQSSMQGMSKASNIMTRRCVLKWKFVKNEKRGIEGATRLRLVLQGFVDFKVSAWKLSQGWRGGQVRDYSQALQRARSN